MNTEKMAWKGDLKHGDQIGENSGRLLKAVKPPCFTYLGSYMLT